MKSTKTEFKIFTILQWEKEQEYLRRQQQNGWRFTRVNFFSMYHFERCQPEDVVYQLDFNQEGAAHREEYLQLFRDCGWEYLQDYVGYSYFRKPLSAMKGGEEAIFCDDASRLDMLERVFRGRVALLLVIFFLCILPQIFRIGQEKSGMEQFFSVFFLVLAAFYLAVFVCFAVQFWKYWRSVHRR